MHAIGIPTLANPVRAIDHALHPDFEANTTIASYGRDRNCLRHRNANPEAGAEAPMLRGIPPFCEVGCGKLRRRTSSRRAYGRLPLETHMPAEAPRVPE